MRRYSHTLAIGASLLACTAGWAEEFGGAPVVIDGDTLQVGERTVDLAGIDAPELDQTCGAIGQTIDCGIVARAQLSDLTAGVDVVCDSVMGFGDGGPLARCSAGGYDLSRNMIYTGWAVVPPGDALDLKAEQAGAKQERRGLWRYVFVPPWEWRMSHGSGHPTAR